ncbi:hypothetical protein [Selenomonas ruminantium]|uniref:hypothetical protein n=1 Tax=Selenomonas ruminantium TaxID=971 RepID=UPI003AFF6807
MLSDKAASKNAHFGTLGDSDSLKGYHFFSIGMGSECYTIIVYGNKKDAEEGLTAHFSRVQFLRTEYKDRRDWHGNRPLKDCIIKACYFSGMFSPKRTRPLADPCDSYELYQSEAYQSEDAA